MGIIKALRQSAERDVAEDIHEDLIDAGWTPPNESWRLRDALDHIKRTAYHSRSQTRRLRWISRRADLALKGEDFTFDATYEPPNAPSVPALEKQLAHAQREIVKAQNKLKAMADYQQEMIEKGNALHAELKFWSGAEHHPETHGAMLDWEFLVEEVEAGQSAGGE